MVTFRFSASAGWIRTLPPAASTSIASSVAAATFAESPFNAARRAATRKTCGVCAAQSSVRSRVSPTTSRLFAPSEAGQLDRLARLIVSATGAAAIAPAASGSASSVASTPSISSAASSGRAASWIATSSVSTTASEFDTDAERVSPPARTRMLGGACGASEPWGS